MPTFPFRPRVVVLPGYHTFQFFMPAKTKVVAAFLDGRRLKGFLFDFSAVRGYFFLFPESEPASQPGARGLLVRVSELKALFFVKEFGGNPGYRQQNPASVTVPGNKVEITFSDGETLVGVADSPSSGGLGFFFTPADPDSNNERIFVIAANVGHIRPMPALASAQRA
jgi:hypothetical protein